jgi:ubiquitin-protein ligase
MGPNSIASDAASEATSKNADFKKPVLPEESTSSSTAEADSSSSSPVKKKKRPKNATVTRKKQTNSKPAKATSPRASASLRRIKKEYEDAVKMGICYDWARQRLLQPRKNTAFIDQEHHRLLCIGPLASNLRHWHFSFRGCGVYENGIYHGRILLPKDYPSTPPHVQLWTPSGRFIPYHDICLSASSYHPESWTPRWTVLSLVQALRLHMLTNAQEIGGKITSREDTLEYARHSLAWKLSFHSGKRTIHVDHALLLQQGVLSLEESSDLTSSQDMREDVNVVVESILDESIPDEQYPAVDHNSSLELKDEASVNLLDDHHDSGVTKSKTSERVRIKPKRKKKKKEGAGIALQQETVQKTKLTFAHSIVLALSKTFGSPARIAFFSLVLFFWVTSSGAT